MKLHFTKLNVQFRGTDLYEQAAKLAYAYETTHAAADADGAPNAYSSADVGKSCKRDPHVGLDCVANAGYPHKSWWPEVLVPDKTDHSKAYVRPSGPYAGFYVSMTSLKDENNHDAYDAAKYVDATKFPYVVIPSGFPTAYSNAAKQGDVGYATYLPTGAATAFVVADSGGGSDAKLGEASIALYAALGFPNTNPRNGHGLPKGTIQYFLFPGSRNRAPRLWPRTNDDIRSQVIDLLSNTDGIDYPSADV